MKLLRLYVFAYWRAVVGVVMTLASSTLGFSGMGLMFFSQFQTIMLAAQGGLLIGASVVCAYVVARCLKEAE